MGWTPDSTGGHNVAISKRFIYNFAGIPDYAKFVNMFDRYKICAVKVTIIPGVGAASGAQAATADSSGSAVHWLGKSVPLVCYVNTNRYGQVNPETWTEANWLQTQAFRRTVLKQRGTSFYMPLNILSDIDSTATGGGTDYVQKRPHFISTQEPQARHYGYTLRLQTADATPLSIAMPSFTVYTKFYIQCAGIKV